SFAAAEAERAALAEADAAAEPEALALAAAVAEPSTFHAAAGTGSAGTVGGIDPCRPCIETEQTHGTTNCLLLARSLRTLPLGRSSSLPATNYSPSPRFPETARPVNEHFVRNPSAREAFVAGSSP